MRAQCLETASQNPLQCNTAAAECSTACTAHRSVVGASPSRSYAAAQLSSPTRGEPKVNTPGGRLTLEFHTHQRSRQRPNRSGGFKAQTV